METSIRSELFSNIYRNKEWGDSGSVSGSGSNLESTVKIRSALPELIEKLGIKSVLDIPCGDFFWMKAVDLTGIHYIGGDIVPDMIEQNQTFYANEDREFRVIDLLEGNLPMADLVICRDCLCHFPFEDAFQALENICDSGCKYLLTTTFPLHSNMMIRLGQWYPINLCAEPFPLPQPILILNEGCDDPIYCDKSLGVWQVGN